LHAICEIVERDAIAKLVGRSKDSPPSGLHTIKLESLPQHLSSLTEYITFSGIEMILISVPSSIDIYTFWSVFYCPGEPTFILNHSAGYGTHTDPVIAASRAITEAAQARLTHIHGAREDLGLGHTNKQLTEAEQAERRSTQTRTMDKMRRLPAYTWEELLQAIPYRADRINIQASLDMVLEMLKRSGRNQVFVHDLTKPNLGIAVSKVFIPGLKVSISMM
jgi:ribosomal protein S12 methylthiotransferase accessory factor